MIQEKDKMLGTDMTVLGNIWVPLALRPTHFRHDIRLDRNEQVSYQYLSQYLCQYLCQYVRLGEYVISHIMSLWVKIMSNLVDEMLVIDVLWVACYVTIGEWYCMLYLVGGIVCYSWWVGYVVTYCGWWV